MMDLDDLKEVNDTLGHLSGDDLLRDFVKIVSPMVDFNLFFRYGGDEFVVILRDTTRDEASELAGKIGLQYAKAANGNTVSIGVASVPEDTRILSELISIADNILYESEKTK